LGDVADKFIHVETPRAAHPRTLTQGSNHRNVKEKPHISCKYQAILV